MSADDLAAIEALIQLYFDGLHHSDTQRLRQVFHPQAVYATAVGDTPIIWRMDEYFPVVDARPAPADRGEARRDRVLSIEGIGPQTALVKAQCAIGPKHFTDLLSLIRSDGRWQVISKVFHYDLASVAGLSATPPALTPPASPTP